MAILGAINHYKTFLQCVLPLIDVISQKISTHTQEKLIDKSLSKKPFRNVITFFLNPLENNR